MKLKRNPPARLRCVLPLRSWPDGAALGLRVREAVRGALLSVLFFGLMIGVAPTMTVAKNCHKTCADDASSCPDSENSTGQGGCRFNITVKCVDQPPGEGLPICTTTRQCETLTLGCGDFPSPIA